MNDRLYFRQLLSGRDFAADGDVLASQMRNFVYLIGDRAAGEAFVVDPAYDPQGIVDVCAADGMRLSGVLATHYHPDHVGGHMMGLSIPGVAELLEIAPVPVHVQAAEAPYVYATTGLEAADVVIHDGGWRGGGRRSARGAHPHPGPYTWQPVLPRRRASAGR